MPFIYGFAIVACIIVALLGTTFLLVAILDADFLALFLFVCCGAFFSLSLWQGVIERDYVHFSREHNSIYKDLTAEGYKFPTTDLNVHDLYVNVAAGDCIWQLNLQKINGKQELTLPSSVNSKITGGNYIVSPSQLARLPIVCS